MMIYHDSRNNLYRYPMGAAACGSVVTLRLRAEGINSAVLRLWWRDSEILVPMDRTDSNMYECDIEMPQSPGLLWYYFRAYESNGNVWHLGNAADGLGGVGEISKEQPKSYQITVYQADFTTPEWMHNSVMMQIMVDRFHLAGKKDPHNLPAGSFYHMKWDEDPVLVCNDRSGDYCDNDYFGGNLRGLMEKLDYLSELGIQALYLNPIFKAHSSHKYNTGNYHVIDPSFGTEEDFRALCTAAHEHGIKIVLDGVFSHTGSDSLYFNRNGNYGAGGAYNDTNSPYYNWYDFQHWPNNYTSWWGFETLPTINKNAPSFRRYIISNKDSVVAHWLNAGSSGWRLDVADELPMDFIAQIRRREKDINPDAALIGEVWEDPSNKVAYGELRCYCTGETLDSTMNYPLREAILLFIRRRLDAGRFVRRFESMRENMPLQFFYAQMNLLGSHDKPRALSVLADIGNMEPERRFRTAMDMDPEAYARGKRRLIAAWKLVCALPGMPCVYYGDEAGMYGMADPFCRGPYPWGREDKELQNTFKEIIHQRNASPALRTGSVRVTACGNDVLLIVREIAHEKDVFGNTFPNETRVLAVNRSVEPRYADFNWQTYEVPAESAQWIL